MKLKLIVCKPGSADWAEGKESRGSDLLKRWTARGPAVAASPGGRPVHGFLA